MVSSDACYETCRCLASLAGQRDGAVTACSEAVTLADVGQHLLGLCQVAAWYLGAGLMVLCLFAVPLNLLVIEQQFTPTH